MWCLSFVSLSRTGIFKHSLSMNRTYLADISPPQQRASFLGMFNSISSLGFIVGPTLGGILSTTENGFQKVAMLSSSLFIFNACFVYFFIPKCGGDKKVKESNTYSGDNIFDGDNKDAGDSNFKKGNSCDRKRYSGGKIDTDRSSSTRRNYYFFALNIFKNIRSIPWTRVWDVFVIRFLLSLAMALFRSNFTSILVYKFQTDPKTNGYILSFNGIISALSGATVKWISLFFNSNSTLQKTFSTVLVFSLLAITFAPSLQMVIASLVPLCIASSVLRVTNVIALYSRGEEKSRGLLNGCRDTLSSISRAIAPLLAGYAQEFSLYGPGLGGSFLAFLATLVAFAASHIKIHID